MKPLAILALLMPAAACALEPMVQPVIDRVDRIERNHFFSNEGERIFTQNIGWNWDSRTVGFRVVFWRLDKNERSPVIKTATGYQWQWWDGDTFRRVEAASYEETWTQYDPELRDREFLGKSQRAELTKPRTAAASGATEGDLE